VVIHSLAPRAHVADPGAGTHETPAALSGSWERCWLRVSRSPEALKPEEVMELQALLQTDNIAPVDRMTFGMRLAEIIIHVRNLRKPRQRE
jgi:hypothetical protein